MIDDLPLWLAIAVSACVLFGALLTLAGCFGMLRLDNFYMRIHAPTMGTSLGGGLILAGSALYFSVTQERLVLHEVAIVVFVPVTTPVTLMLLARATLFRDRIEGVAGLPRRPAPKSLDDAAGEAPPVED